MVLKTTAEVLHHRAEELGGNLPPLLVAAEQIAALVAQGIHGRRKVGQGETFWEFRRYKFGDPAQRIDWRQSAKSDRIYIRETEWEAAQSIWLWRDETRSMQFSSSAERPTKFDRATLLLMALAVLLDRGGEHVALSGHISAPGKGRLSLPEMSETLSRAPVDDSSVPVDDNIPRNARMVLFGDFLAPPEGYEVVLKRLAGRKISGILVHVFDPAEAALPYSGRVRFQGLEGEAPLLLDRVEDVRAQYQKLWMEHTGYLKQLASSIGWQVVSHDTSTPPCDVLMQLYILLSQIQGAKPC